MKRRKLESHLNEHGCTFVREGGNHSLWANVLANTQSTVPRHNEIVDWLASKICKDLKIPPIRTS